MIHTNTLIIGASAAGLASAACLKQKGIPFIILEKEEAVGIKWRNHYDRLHLHTSKNQSALPFKKFSTPSKYPSRTDVVEYLDQYVKELEIDPVYNCTVQSVEKIDEHWETRTANECYQSRNVIIATGLNNIPKIPNWNGLDSFKGKKLHSSAYKNGKEFSGQKVLVVGFGNSACEQAICLVENGASPSLSVRSAVNIIPRDILGFPVLEMGKLTSFLPARLADKINAPLIKLIVGDIRKLGLKKSNLGPKEQIEKLNRIPLLDIGTVKLIKEGRIKVFGDIIRIENNLVFFEDGRSENFDAIIFATGYKHGIESILNLVDERLVDLKKVTNHQSYFGKDGLYFCGFYVSPMGMLREIGIEARRIAEDIFIKEKI
ncbi:MAG: NAD(P)/FAD-dependent oxidoreductase [Ginsengibacter sp.]